MNILHKRVYNKQKPNNGGYCISHVYIDGKYSHDTIEDYDRGLDQSMTEAQARAIKVPDKTAIPTGTYTLKFDIVSGTFSQKKYYHDFCVWTRPDCKHLYGCVPRFDPVVGFKGILMHRGINENSSSGCVIVGLNKKVGQVTDSQAVFERVYRLMTAAAKRGEKVTYTIERTYTVK